MEHSSAPEMDGELSVSPQYLCLTEQPPRSPIPCRPSPFLSLPTELRLRIYSLLVLPRQPNELAPSYDRVRRSMQDSFDYDGKRYGIDRSVNTDPARPTLIIRTIEPETFAMRNNATHAFSRSTFNVRSDRFRARTMTTTYHCINMPHLKHHTGILGVNRQIHAEVAEMLYGGYTFDFDTHVECIVPFLSDLTPFARSCIKSLRVVKRAIPYEKEFDKCEWTSAMRYLTAVSSGLFLRRLDLGVVAGRPGPHGWDRIGRYSASDFGLLKELKGMEWLQHLLEFRGLKELNVNAVVEHCYPGNVSLAMAGFIRFSASVESGFRQFLTQHLLIPAS